MMMYRPQEMADLEAQQNKRIRSFGFGHAYREMTSSEDFLWSTDIRRK